MGLFKDMKQMKDTVAAAPGLIQQAQELQAASQQMAVQQQAMAAAAYGAPGAVGEADLEPIAGVPLALYAEISRSLAGVNYDLAQAPALAAARGIQAGDWATAVAGWNQRMAGNPALAQHFNRLYTGQAGS